MKERNKKKSCIKKKSHNKVMDILVIRNVILERVSTEGNINGRNARVGSDN